MISIKNTQKKIINDFFKEKNLICHLGNFAVNQRIVKICKQELPV